MPDHRLSPKDYERDVYQDHTWTVRRQRERGHRQHVPRSDLPIWAAFIRTDPRWPTYSFPMAYTHRAARQMNVRADVRCKSRSMPRNGLFDRYHISVSMKSLKKAGGFYYDFTFEVVDCPAYSYHHFRYGHNVQNRLPRYSHPYLYETVPASRNRPQRYHIYYLRLLRYDARPRLKGRNEGDYQRLASVTPSLVGEWKAQQHTLGFREPHHSAIKTLHELQTTEVAAAKLAASGRYDDPLSDREQSSLERRIERNQQRGYSDIKRFFVKASHRDTVNNGGARPAEGKGKGRDTEAAAGKGTIVTLDCTKVQRSPSRYQFRQPQQPSPSKAGQRQATCCQ